MNFARASAAGRRQGPGRGLLPPCLAVLLAFQLGCTAERTTGDPTWFQDGFHGITQTSTEGPDAIGWFDPDDWAQDGTWDARYPLEACNGQAKIAARSANPDTVVPEPVIGPTTFRLRPAYPNPTEGSTTIEFDLAEECNAYAAVIDESYRTVTLLACRRFEPGSYAIGWEPRYGDGRALPEDVYRVIFLARDEGGRMLFASHGDILLDW